MRGALLLVALAACGSVSVVAPGDAVTVAEAGVPVVEPKPEAGTDQNQAEIVPHDAQSTPEAGAPSCTSITYRAICKNYPTRSACLIDCRGPLGGIVTGTGCSTNDTAAANICVTDCNACPP